MEGGYLDKLDHCGVFAIYSPTMCLSRAETGMFSQQHRGTTSCGLSCLVNVRKSQEIKTETHKGSVKEFFKIRPDLVQIMKGAKLTIGCASVTDVPIEPCYGNFDFALAFNGRIYNYDELFKKSVENGSSFHTKEDIELIANEIGKGKDPVDGITRYLESMLEGKICGSTSGVLLAKDGIYVFSDPWKIKPLCYGSYRKRGKDIYFAASEDRGIQVLSGHIKDMIDVKPGEILRITENGIKSLKRVWSGKRKYCGFEWGYIASIDSIIDKIPVHLARKYLGMNHAEKDRGRFGEDVVVAAIPQSGVGHGLGYHERSASLYVEVFLKYGFSGRSFILPTQELRDLEAQEKITVIRSAVKGKIVILLDDSIVRGTQIREKVVALKEGGAKEVHVRIACPPLVKPCFGDKSTKDLEELAAPKYPEEELEMKLGKKIRANSLRYNTLDEFLTAILKADREWNSRQTVKPEDFCTYCWDREEIIPTDF